MGGTISKKELPNRKLWKYFSLRNISLHPKSLSSIERFLELRKEIEKLLLSIDRDSTNFVWADAASRGSFLEKFPEIVGELIERKEFMSATNRKKTDERLDGLERMLDEITSFFKTSTPQVARICEIFTSTDHYADECLNLEETTVEEPS
ncbi:hypothetical protein V8G54_036261 [Vigna mungo]|uniref:Uncharacterized protein n=1 Tax=Vigna mungo TaxID=3915 RepID=A0AAQ3RFF1_VIGMU